MSSSSALKDSQVFPRNLDKLNEDELVMIDRFAEFLLQTRERQEARRRFEEARAEWARRTADVDGVALEAMIGEAVSAVRAEGP